MFAQGDGGRVDNRKCFRCGRKGHIATNCPAEKPGAASEEDDDGEHLHTMRAVEGSENEESEGYSSGKYEDENEVDGDDDAVYFFHQRDTKGLSRDWLLLDSQSSTDMFCNRDYLRDVKAAARPTTIHCNAGTTVCIKEGIISSEEFGDIPVKYHPTGICNIISLKTMKKLFPFSYCSTPNDPESATFRVSTKNGIVEFKPCAKGLHYFDLSTTTQEAVMHVQTVQHNFEGFSKDQVLRAIKARKLQAMLGSPAKADYEGMVRGKLLDDCPIDVVDLRNAHTIFGPDLAGLRGRTVRRRPERVTTDVVAVPRDFVRLHKFVTLTADIMFVNGIPFLLTRSRGIQLITVEFLPRQTAKIIGEKLTRVLQLYQRADFVVQTALMDKEFDAVADQCPTLPINTTAANEHVPEIERAIRLVKERARGIENTLPFTGLPRLITIELIHFIVLWLNNFPVKSGVSTKYSPRELICRHRLNAKVHCKTPFGAYCEVHDEPTPSNSMTPRTHETICMGPTGNIQGSYKFYCLKTKKKLTRRRWDELPMPRSIIRKVDRHAKNDKAASRLTFTDRNNRTFQDIRNEEYDDEPEGLVEQEPSPFPDIPSEMPGIELTEHAESTTAIPIPDEQAETAIQARIAAENAGLAYQEAPAIEVDDGSSVLEAEISDQGADDGVEGELLDQDEDEGELSDHEGDNLNTTKMNETGGLLDEGAGEDEPGESDDEGAGTRRSKRARKVSTRLQGFEHNMSAMYAKEDAEKEVDEYMHATLSEEKYDLKLSHRRKVEVKKIEQWLRSIYGNISVSHGDKHTYLGMDLDYSEKGKCRITMPGYTKEVINAFPEVINGSAATPAADHLFQTREDGKKLPEEQAAAFHRTTAQLLFLSGRARRDIQTVVAFLTTRVKNPDEDDWGKLKRVLRYLNGTVELGLCLSAKDIGLVQWYVDASYATHDDCKGHTGAMMTLGDGAVISRSREQKTNARSSTEAELIGVYDALPTILHTKYFLEAMGYGVKQNVIYQDNKSSITLERNGRTSSSKRTKHIKIRYFFIKDMIDQQEVEIQHCPTTEM
eukprot:CCRYP_021211-RA/>CCRYP_021211-RA protein AED:0.16 eAED:0.16 QI:0/0/0/0.66/1/1/3/0/1057